MNKDNVAEKVMEQLADVEHTRWSDWQGYMHGKMVYGEETDSHSGNILAFYKLPADYYERWERQIDTPYSELTEAEKESDRNQVRRYLPIIEQLLTSHRLSLKEELMKKLPSKGDVDMVDSLYVARWCAYLSQVKAVITSVFKEK